MEREISRSLRSKYSVNIGIALEDKVREIADRLNVTHEKGHVNLVDNKEVDVAIPNLETPTLLIMVSYSVTTSSSQTQRANEQSRMYDHIQSDNRSRSRAGMKPVVFANVIDGGGWIARDRDLTQMWRNCDYCFSYQDFDDLSRLIEEHAS